MSCEEAVAELEGNRATNLALRMSTWVDDTVHLQVIDEA